MVPSKFENLLVKYFSGSIRKTELDDLNNWLENEEREQMEDFSSYVRINYAINSTMSRYNSERSRSELMKKIREDKRGLRFLKMRKWMGHAAMAIFLFGIGYLYLQGFFTPAADPASSSEAQITLRLGDGSLQTITAEGSNTISDAKGAVIGIQKGASLHYQATETPDIIRYNTLSVPYGKMFELVLSDKSKVFLNSGTSITFPVHFAKGDPREVFLDGEAYFEVSKDEKHPFIVNANNLKVRVLGTQFVVSSYPEDKDVSTVLVEGSVGLYRGGEEFIAHRASILQPGHRATWDKSQQDISIETVTTEKYTAWMNGRIVFSHLPFKEIVRKLERHYNVTITNRNKELGEEFFTASFDTENIEQVLQAFSKSYPFKYEITDKEIIIN